MRSVTAAASVRGFTLIELLVVLVVIGLITGIAAPNLEKLTGSVERATTRDGLVADIAGLSYRAFAMGQGFELNEDTFGKLLVDGNPLLAVPDGWRVKLRTPIQFTFNGFCSGGVVQLTAPDATVELLVLDPPACRVRSNAS